MSAPLYLSRARIRRDVPAAALRALIVPGDDGHRAGAGHKLVWTLFADAPDRERDFLWREAEAGLFYLLSRRVPNDPHGLFDLDPPKPFEPVFAVGDRLTFSLRANATVSKARGPGIRGKPCDVVMAAIKDVPAGERAAARREAVELEGRKWLEAQGTRCGFRLPGDGNVGDGGAEKAGHPVRMTAYRTLRIDHSGPAARIGVLDLEGIIEVREPERFLEALAGGFGRAKAFGCGLMLVRRA